MDKDRLAKLLSLSQSDNDNEALSAIRNANAMLKKAGLTWQQVLGSAPPPTQRPRSHDFDFDDMMRDWVRDMGDMMRGAEQNRPPGQSEHPTNMKVKEMIERCLSRNYSTAKMMTILEKIRSGKTITSTEEQYVKAIHEVVCKS